MKLIDHFRQRILKFWTVRIQLASAFLSLTMWMDPPTLLAVWGMMPEAMRAVLPESLFQTIGAIIFLSNILTIIARGVAQKDKTNEQASK